MPVKIGDFQSNQWPSNQCIITLTLNSIKPQAISNRVRSARRWNCQADKISVVHPFSFMSQPIKLISILNEHSILFPSQF